MEVFLRNEAKCNHVTFINTMGVKIFKWEQHLVGFLANLEEINGKKICQKLRRRGGKERLIAFNVLMKLYIMIKICQFGRNCYIFYNGKGNENSRDTCYEY